MDLVYEEDRALPVHAQSLPGLCGLAPQVRNARGDRADRAEVALGLPGHDACQGRLAGAGRTPQDDGRQLVGLDTLAQNTTGSDDVLLPNEIVEGARSHPGGQRRLA